MAGSLGSGFSPSNQSHAASNHHVVQINHEKIKKVGRNFFTQLCRSESSVFIKIFQPSSHRSHAAETFLCHSKPLSCLLSPSDRATIAGILSPKSPT
jgi:hypothetical protein